MHTFAPLLGAAHFSDPTHGICNQLGINGFARDLAYESLGFIQRMRAAGQQGVSEFTDFMVKGFRIHHFMQQPNAMRLNGIEAIRNNLNNQEVDQSGNSTTFIVAALDCLANAVFDNKRS